MKGKCLQIVLMILLAGGCLNSCTPSKGVTKLVDHAISNQETLGKAHQASLDNQQKLLSKLPPLYEKAAETLNESCSAMVNAKKAFLNAEIDRNEQELYYLFEVKAWQLFGESFEQRFESVYLPPMNAMAEKAVAERKALGEKRKNFPNDATVAEAYSKKQANSLTLNVIMLRDELELKDSLTAGINNARAEVHQMIRAQLAPIRQSTNALAHGVCSRTASPESLDTIQTALKEFREPVIQLHAAQGETLTTIKSHINRRSPVELVFIGAGNELKGRVTGLQEKAGDELDRLDGWLAGMGRKLLSKAEVGTNALRNQLSLAGEKVRNGIDKALAKAAGGIDSEMSDLVGKTLKRIETKFDAVEGE